MIVDLYAGAQSRFVDLPGGRFHYLAWGAEQTEKPGILLIHGITSSVGSWLRVGPALADRYRVYAFDMRGHGDSVKPGRGAYSLRQTADDAIAFMEAVRLEKPVVIGHSWGGATALVLASGAGSEQPVPDLSKLILEDPALHFGEGDPLKRAEFYTKDIGRPPAELRSELIAANPEWAEVDIEGKIDALSKVTREAVISVFEQTTPIGIIAPLLARLKIPTLLMRADPDNGTILPAILWDQALQYLPANCRTIQIDGATHNIHRNRFDAFMQTVNDFLNA